jgi:hypothetical protein
MADNDMHRVPLSRLCEVLGLSARRVGQLIAEGVIPAPRNARYDLGGCCQGYIRFLKSVPKDTSLADARKLLLQEKAAIAKLQRQQLDGSLVALGDVFKSLDIAYQAMKARLLGIPTKLVPRLTANPQTNFRLTTDFIREALDEIAQWTFTAEETPKSEAAE